METSFILVSVFIAMVTVIIYLRVSSRKSKITLRKMGIPGPAPWPIIGNLPEMMKEGILFYHHRPYKEFENEKLYTVSVASKEFLIIKDLDMIRDICIKSFNNFVDRRLIFDKEPYGNMMTQLKGDHWRHVRNAVSPTFSSGKLKRMFAHIEETSRVLTTNIKQTCEEDKAVELKEMSSSFTMDVIASVGFGVKVDSVNNRDADFVTHAKRVMKGLTNILVLIALASPSLGSLLEKLGIDVFCKKPAEYFSWFVREAMTNREKGDNKRYDFLQLVVDAEETSTDITSGLNSGSRGQEKKGLTHAEIQGTALVFILASYETVSTTLSFTMFLLAHHPECREKLQEELDRVLKGKFPTYENVAELTYMDMCINESLRMYSPTFILERQCNNECDIGGYHIPKDTHIVFPVLAIHHDPKLWPEPEKFDPERFTSTNKEGRHPFAHLPFGQGPRNCIGMRLALLEIKVALASILQEMSPVPCEKSAFPPVLGKRRLTAVNGLWVNFEPRKTSQK